MEAQGRSVGGVFGAGVAEGLGSGVDVDVDFLDLCL